MRVLSIALQAMLVLALGWICRPVEFGVFVVIVAHATLSATLCAGGSLQGALRVAHLLTPGSAWEVPLIRLLAGSALRRSTVASVLVAVALWLNPVVPATGIAAGMLLALALSMSSFASGLTIARGEAAVNQAFELWLRLPIQASGVVVLFATDRLSAPALITLSAVAASAQGVALFVRVPLRGKCARTVPSAMSALLGRFITSASVNAVLFTLLSSLDVLLGSRIVAPTDIAPLGIAGRIAGALATLHGAVFDFHASAIAKSLRGRFPAETRRLCSVVSAEATALTVVTAAAAAIAVFAMPEEAPETYRMAVAPLGALLAARLITGALGPSPAILTLRGMHARLAAITAAGIAVEGVLVVSLARPFGATGLALASGVGMCAYSLLARLSSRRALGHGALAPECDLG
jgi:hypothetical protein